MIKKIFTVSVVVLTIFWAVGLAAFVPTAQAVAISSGDLIKASQPAVYYYGADGKRYVFPNEKTYKTWYVDFSGVKTITDGELATFQIGGNVTMKPGVKLGKITTDPRVYAVAANGTLREIGSESVAASLYGSTWNKMIDDIADSFFTNYSIGAKINAVADFDVAATTAAAQSINVDKGLSGTTTTGGNVSVSLASDTPAPATVAVGASANMTKITLSTGSAAASIKSLYVTRSGLSTNDDITNIKLVDMNGATVGSVGSLGSNSKALLTFVPTISIAANTSVSYFIRASVNAPGVGLTNTGNTVALGISVATDVILEAGTVTGSFPAVGNYMSIVQLAGLGTVAVGQDAAVVDSKPDAGAKRVLTSEFYIQAGANEDVTVSSLSLIEAGSANTSDSNNIELYSLTEGRTLGTVSAWDANARATFGSLNVVIPKGSKHILQVYLDVLGGSGQTIDVDLTDGGDALLNIKGNTYGFYLTPTINPPLPAVAWDGQGIPGNAIPAGGQTVNTGSLNITKSNASPATGNIAKASEQALTTWDFEVRGESAKITSTKVTMTLGGGLAIADLANAKIVDENGTVVAGPKAIAAAAVTFTETNIVPTGTHKYTYKVDILSTAPNGGTISASIALPNGGDITSTGINTRDNTIISAAPAPGNVQTILGVALTVTTLTQPAARLVSAGTQNYVWATASLDATNSGEDVRVSSITVTDTYTGAGDFTEIQNVSIWADLTTANSDRGDAYETKVSNNEQPIAATAAKAISLTQVITIPRGTFVKIAVVGSLSTLADIIAPVGTHTLKISGRTATGKSTGNAPALVFVGNGQLMTNTGAGTLTTAIDASSPLVQILVSGQQKVTVATLKLSANNVENQDLDQVIITDGGTDVVSGGWYLYASARSDSGSIADPVAVAPGGATANFQLADNTVTIPANGSVVLTVKTDVAPVDGVTVVNGNTLQVTKALPGDVQSTGKSSGAIIIGSPFSGTLVSNSLANPTVVTTVANHGLTTGDVVTITGSNSTPLIDGSYVATVTGVTTFTIPVNVTVAGTAGTFIGHTILGATTDIAYASKPTITLNASSPSGILVPSANTLVAIFNIAADSADDISFDDAGSAGSKLVVNVDADCTTPGATAMILKDEGGVVLSTATEGADACTTGAKTFQVWTNPLIISKGTTKKVYVYGVTSGATATGDNLQASIRDTAANVTWGINGTGAFATGHITARGTIYANALSR